MHAETILFPGDPLKEDKIRGRTAVIIDVLRLSSTIITAMENGAESIYSSDTIEGALKLKSRLTEESKTGEIPLLGGERDGFRIEGFDLGNSPLEYTRSAIGGRTIILSSTNGSQALKNCSGADGIIIGAPRNCERIADYIISKNKNIVFFLSGRLGNFSLEDAVGAGLIIDLIRRKTSLDLSDSSIMCADLHEKYGGNFMNVFNTGFHGKYLRKIGMERDLVFCAEIGVSRALPAMTEEKCLRNIQ